MNTGVLGRYCVLGRRSQITAAVQLVFQFDVSKTSAVAVTLEVTRTGHS